MARSIFPAAIASSSPSTSKAGSASTSISPARVRAPATSAAPSMSSRNWSPSMSDLTRRTLLAGAAATTLHAMAPDRILDPHVHVWKHDPAFPFAEGAKVPDRDATPETLLDHMQFHGVARTVIIQVIHYKYDNRYLSSVLKRHKGMFHGVCRVDPLDPAAPDHLSAHTADGFRGVRLSPAG